MKYDPHVHYLTSKMVENIGWHDALAELIDNAFDANANRAELVVANKSVTVTDDGRGCSDLGAMARLGVHKRQSSTSLGMHGRGLKDAWFYLGDVMQIESVKGSVLHEVTLSVSELVSNQWEGPDPTVSDTDRNPGTVITFPGTRRTTPKPETWAKLSITFMPALNDGKQIVVKTGQGRRRPIKAFVPPIVSDAVVESFEVNGKPASINIGIIPEGQRNTTTGFLLTYGHRTIGQSAIGVGEYSSSRLAGIVRLGKGWKLTPHKDAIAEDVPALSDAIYSRIQAIAERAHQQSQIAESDAFKLELEGELHEGLKRLREKRKSDGKDSGTVPPVGTGRRRRKARKTHNTQGGVENGNNKPKRCGISIDISALGEAAIGHADPMANRVTVNSDHPFVSANWNVNAPAIAAVAMAVYSHSRCNSDGGQAFGFEMFDFIEAWSAMLQSWKDRENAKA
jgi:hypothetical protein